MIRPFNEKACRSAAFKHGVYLASEQAMTFHFTFPNGGVPEGSKVEHDWLECSL